MKPLYKVLFVVGAFLLIACEKDNDSPQGMGDGGQPIASNTFFLADVEGIALNADLVTGSSDSLRITISAENSVTSQKLQLVLPESIQEGSFTFSNILEPNKAKGTYYPNTAIDSLFLSESGILTITEIDEFDQWISGNTVFTAANPSGDGVIEITFCEFRIQY